jgi:TonB-dependent SusC/RagA subfamily outer membrane receptor
MRATCFFRRRKKLRIQVTSNKEKYLPREAVDLQIKTTDFTGEPLKAKVSLAVIDDKIISFADDKQDNLLSAMLLSSEVKGEIQEPSFYFDPEEPKAELALDNLLMTQGWRRFTWNDILDSKRTISYAPEKIKNIGGTLLDDKGVGISSEVTLLELGGRKRIVKVRTTSDGHFIFKNIDPKIPILLLTKKPGEIIIQKNPTLSVSLNDKEGTVILPELTRADDKTVSPVATKTQVTNQSEEAGLDLALGLDVTQLSEVVVTALGVEEARGLTGSIVRVTENSTEGLFSNPTIESSLQGRVGGLVVQPQTGNPGAQTNLIIRGSSSVGSGRGEPLFVIDGHPIGGSLNQNFSNGSMVGPEDILSIEVINTPEMTALYGSSASNGVILITTKSRLGYTHFSSKRKSPKYSSNYITPRKFSQTREFYIPHRQKIMMK